MKKKSEKKFPVYSILFGLIIFLIIFKIVTEPGFWTFKKNDSFKNLRIKDNKPVNSTPSALRWKDHFQHEKKETKKESYIQSRIKENNK